MPYGFKRSITTDHTKCGSTDSSSFTVLVYGTYNGSGGIADLRTVANGGKIQNTVSFNGQTVPADLKFTSDSAGNSLLSWEVASYNASSGAIEIWVLLSTLSHTSDIVFYMFYGDASVSTYQGGSVGAAWDSFNKNVYHFIENAANTTVNDSTSNGNNGTASSNTSVFSTTGQIAKGFNFGASTANVQLPNAITIGATGGMTSLVWIKGTNTSGMGLVTLESGGNALYRFEYVNDGFANPANSLTFLFRDGGGAGLVEVHGVSTAIADGNWHQVGVTLDGSNNIILYVDGAQLTTGSTTRSNSSTFSAALSTIGGSPTDGFSANDTLDQPELSTTARSADWITAEYNNQNIPDKSAGAGGFYTIGSEIISAGIFNKIYGFFQAVNRASTY